MKPSSWSIRGAFTAMAFMALLGSTAAAQVRQWRDSGAQILFSHDGNDFKTYRQPPAYYD